MTPGGALAEPGRSRLRRWAGAAAVVLSLHAGGAAAIITWQDREADEAAGPITVELAPFVMASAVQMPDVAHGPLMQESVVTPTAVKQLAEEVDKETPQLEPSPLAPDPEVALPVPRQVREIEPEEEKERKVATPQEATAAQASPAPLTTAPPRVEAEPALRAAAPAPGASSAPSQARASWHRALVTHLNRHKRYPRDAEAHRVQGTVSVEFSVDRSGRVVSSRVLRSSGSASLDDEALAVLLRASPLPTPPDHVAGTSFDLEVPFQFRMKR